MPTSGDGHIFDTVDVSRFDPELRAWTAAAIARVRAEANRSSDTHLLQLPLPAHWNIDLYLKDESTHPTGSLKHRLARSLFLYALCNGWLRPDRPVIEASSGSTAVSEAYFARLVGVPFIAVMAADTSPEKIALIALNGGQCRFVDRPSDVYLVARQLAEETGGHYIDQFTYAERATDWRGNNNIAESLFAQLAEERFPNPSWIIATAGTGGTSATIGRYVRFAGKTAGLCVADPQNSAFFESWRTEDPTATTEIGSRIEGIGRQRVEPSFIESVIDRMIVVPDAASIASMLHLAAWTGRRAGASTGTGLWAAFRIISEMRQRGETGSIVGLLCDDGDRYREKYYSEAWLTQVGLDPQPYLEAIQRFMATGALE